MNHSLYFNTTYTIASEAAYAKGDNDILALDRVRHGLKRNGDYKHCLICNGNTRRYEAKTQTRYYCQKCGFIGYTINGI